MTTIRRSNPKHDIPKVVSSGREIDMAVAYITRDGLNEIKVQLEELLDRDIAVRVMLDLESGNTDPSAVWELFSLADEHETFQVRTIVPGKETGILHAKIYIAHDDSEVTLLTGSANLTGAALHRNSEHVLWLDGRREEPELAEAVSTFEEFWNDPQAKPIDAEAARLYEAYCGRLRRSQTRAERRAESSWRALAEHLSSAGQARFTWPSVDAAYLMGVIAARGELQPDHSRIEIKLTFRHGGYKDGKISVRDTSFVASEVLPQIPRAIASRIRNILPIAKVSVENQNIHIDLEGCRDEYEIISDAYSPHTNTNNFRLPKYLRDSSDEVVIEFIKGFSVSCALLTDHTSMPKNQRTGLPGQMMVWLRPKQSNERLFNLIYGLITDRLGIAVYKHLRSYREPHLKIHCENFQQIGFGIGWWDELVAAGADYNFELFPQSGFNWDSTESTP